MPRDSVRALRLLVRAHLHWERALDTPRQYLEAHETAEMWDSLGYQTLHRVRDRFVDRWKRSDHYERSRQVYADQHMRRYNRAAWEAKQHAAEARKARQEYAALRVEVAQLRALIPDPTPQDTLRRVIADSGLTTVQVGRALGFNTRRALAGFDIAAADLVRIHAFRELVDSLSASTPAGRASLLLDSSRGQSLFSEFASAAPTMQRIRFGVPVEERLGLDAPSEETP
jgi:hypothetical protein